MFADPSSNLSISVLQVYKQFEPGFSEKINKYKVRLSRVFFFFILCSYQFHLNRKRKYCARKNSLHVSFSMWMNGAHFKFHLCFRNSDISCMHSLQPGDAKMVVLVSIGGVQVIRGGNGIADGPVDVSQIEKVMDAVTANGFGNEPQAEVRFGFFCPSRYGNKIHILICTGSTLFGFWN